MNATATKNQTSLGIVKVNENELLRVSSLELKPDMIVLIRDYNQGRRFYRSVRVVSTRWEKPPLNNHFATVDFGNRVEELLSFDTFYRPSEGKKENFI